MKKLKISYLFLFLSFSLGSDTMSRTVVVVGLYVLHPGVLLGTAKETTISHLEQSLWFASTHNALIVQPNSVILMKC